MVSLIATVCPFIAFFFVHRPFFSLVAVLAKTQLNKRVRMRRKIIHKNKFIGVFGDSLATNGKFAAFIMLKR